MELDGRERGRGRNLVAHTRSHNSHRPISVQSIGHGMGLFNVDVMACTTSVLRSPKGGEALPVFTQYICTGCVGMDLLAPDVSLAPGTTAPAFRFCFGPPVMAGDVFQELAERSLCRCILPPDVKRYWFPLVQLAAVPSIELAPVAARGCFQRPSPNSGVSDCRQLRWRMVAYEIDFRNMP